MIKQWEIFPSLDRVCKKQKKLKEKSTKRNETKCKKEISKETREILSENANFSLIFNSFYSEWSFPFFLFFFHLWKVDCLVWFFFRKRCYDYYVIINWFNFEIFRLEIWFFWGRFHFLDFSLFADFLILLFFGLLMFGRVSKNLI